MCKFIENHFDIDAELVEGLRQSGKEDLLAQLEFEREDLNTSTPGSGASLAWATPSCAPSHSSASGRSWSPWAIR